MNDCLFKITATLKLNKAYFGAKSTNPDNLTKTTGLFIGSMKSHFIMGISIDKTC